MLIDRFGTVEIFEGKLYIQTGKNKAVSRQIRANPKVELCAWWNLAQSFSSFSDELKVVKFGVKNE